MTTAKEDWKRDFYKNGMPTEVIVIEDTPPPSTTPVNNTPYRVEQSIPYLLGPPAASTRSKRTRKDTPKNSELPLPPPPPPSTVKRRKKDGGATITAAQGKYKSVYPEQKKKN